jgi:hypothetical protein
VAEVLELPLGHLLDADCRGDHLQSRGTVSFRAPHFQWDGHLIWGATAMILAELAAAVRELGGD